MHFGLHILLQSNYVFSISNEWGAQEREVDIRTKRRKEKWEITVRGGKGKSRLLQAMRFFIHHMSQGDLHFKQGSNENNDINNGK